MSSATDTMINALEESIVQHFGQITLGNLISLIIMSMFYGIFLILFSMSVHMTFHQGGRSRASWAALVGTSVNFALQTVEFIMSFIWLILSFQTFLLKNDTLSLEDRLALERTVQTPFAIPLTNLDIVPLIISDAFMIWRASALFTHKWALSIPLVCLIGTIGAYIGMIVVPLSDQANISLTWALLSLSLATNLITTGMIGWRLWTYRKHVLPALGGKKSPVHQIIITLVESGAAFCFIQLVTLILQIVFEPASDPTTRIIVYSAALQILTSLGTMYPTFILLICRNQSSRIDQVASLSISVGNDLRFATVRASQSESLEVSADDLERQSSHSSMRETKPKTGDVGA